MIEVTLEELALTLITITLLVIVLTSLSTRLSESLRRARIARTRLSCRVCGFSWEDRSKAPIVTCPHCERPTQRGRSRRLG